jgi:hypothetical protein
MKLCKKCDLQKPESAFFKKKTGLRPYCNEEACEALDKIKEGKV